MARPFYTNDTRSNRLRQLWQVYRYSGSLVALRNYMQARWGREMVEVTTA